MTTIHIKNLRMRTIIGIEDFERTKEQDIIINANVQVDAEQASDSDDIADAFNYKTATKQIISLVEDSQFFLLEKLVNEILELIMADEKVLAAEVEIDKPNALRFADSVSVKASARK